MPLREIAVFLEKHARCGPDGERLPHLSALTRCDGQHQWNGVALELYTANKIRVDYSVHIKTWYDGVVYGTVSSDHKPEAELDRDHAIT